MDLNRTPDRTVNRRKEELALLSFIVCFVLVCAGIAGRHYALFADGLWREMFFDYRFDRVVPGMEENLVVKMLGPCNSEIVGSLHGKVWDSTVTSVTKTVTYYGFALSGVDFDIGYDQNHRVVATDVSPAS